MSNVLTFQLSILFYELIFFFANSILSQKNKIWRGWKQQIMWKTEELCQNCKIPIHVYARIQLKVCLMG